jgi:phospholipase/carboxylesterase
MQTQNSLLSTIEINPNQTPIGTVILLHGLGADGNDFAPVVPELLLPDTIPLRFIFPNAPIKAITMNNGYRMPAWYDITSIDIHKRADVGGITESVKQIEKLIAHEEKRGIPCNKIVLAGFSQGAVIALRTGLNFPQPLAGILALSGYLPNNDIDLRETSRANLATPIFIGHGTQDGIVPYALGQAAYEFLKKSGYAASLHTYPMAHSVNEKEIQDISAWLQNIFKK